MRWYFIDRIIEFDADNRLIKGIKSFTRSEVFFMDHFHGHPIVPGVLQIEMIATTGGKALKMIDETTLPMLAKVKESKFIKSIRPGDQCIISAEIHTLKKNYAISKGEIHVDGQRVCASEVMYTLQPASIADTSWKDPVIAEWEAVLAHS